MTEIAVKLKNTQNHFTPATRKILETIGERIMLRRKRRLITEKKLSNDTGLARSTLQAIEKGNPGVAVGSYIRVMYMLGMEADLLILGDEDESGRIIQDKKLLDRFKKNKGIAKPL